MQAANDTRATLFQKPCRTSCSIPAEQSHCRSIIEKKQSKFQIYMQSISYFDVVHILVHYTVAWPSTWWMVYCGDRKELLKILESLTLTPTAIIINMALVGLFTLALPLGLGIFFWRKSKGRWRFSSLAVSYSPSLCWSWSGLHTASCSMALLEQCCKGTSLVRVFHKGKRD